MKKTINSVFAFLFVFHSSSHLSGLRVLQKQMLLQVIIGRGRQASTQFKEIGRRIRQANITEVLIFRFH